MSGSPLKAATHHVHGARRVVEQRVERDHHRAANHHEELPDQARTSRLPDSTLAVQRTSKSRVQYRLRR